jgi:hypothetical protein
MGDSDRLDGVVKLPLPLPLPLPLVLVLLLKWLLSLTLIPFCQADAVADKADQKRNV